MSSGSTNSAILKLRNASFFKSGLLNASSRNPIFQREILKFELQPSYTDNTYWGVIGPKKSEFLEIIAGKHLALPSNSRVYYPEICPTCSPKIQFLNFQQSFGVEKAHLSARFESLSSKNELDLTDDANSVLNYVMRKTDFNNSLKFEDDVVVEYLLDQFDLISLRQRWIKALSNGQTRRAKIARAFLPKPYLMIIDDPFLGIDQTHRTTLSRSLHQVSSALKSTLVLGFRNIDEIPAWVTHVAYVDDSGLTHSGEKHVVEKILESMSQSRISGTNDGYKSPRYVKEPTKIPAKDPIIEFRDASVIYKGVLLLEKFSWSIERGSRWRIIGDNGTGKTTILALITADHPQSWRSVVSMNGHLRKSGCGITYFDINETIGISSPELHANVPARSTMKELVYNGLVRGIGNNNFHFAPKSEELSIFAKHVLREFETEFNSHKDTPFNELTMSVQKLTLFLRAVIKNPEILILDEAFSSMDDERLMRKCLDFVNCKMEGVTVLCIGHIDCEVPRHEFALKLQRDPSPEIQFFKRDQS